MKNFIIVTIFLVSASQLFASVLTVSNNPATIAQFSTIQAAIDAANNGDTIYVHGSPDTYDGALISKRVTVIGPGWAPASSSGLRTFVQSIEIRGPLATGTEVQGLSIGFLLLRQGVGGAPDNIRIIRNEISSDIQIGNFISDTFDNYLFEGNFFNESTLVANSNNKYKNFLFTNNLFVRSNIPFLNFSGTENFILDHNLFCIGFSGLQGLFGNCRDFMFTNNIFNGLNAASGLSFCTFKNNITFFNDVSEPWALNGNIDGGGNIPGQDPQMVDQLSVNAGAVEPLLDFTIPEGPADNSGTDGKDMGLLFDASGSRNWAESRNSLLPRVTFVINDLNVTGDTVNVRAGAGKDNETTAFVRAEYFIDADPGVGNGIPVDLSSDLNSIIFFASAPINSLSAGIHNLAIRVQQADGVWSLFDRTSFFKTPEPPIANAGVDQAIVLPLNQVTLDGSGSSDADGSITLFIWSKLSGPAEGFITDTRSAVTQAVGLVAGVYEFELFIADDFNLLSTDTVQVIVDAFPPIANAGPDQVVSLPLNEATLDGSASVNGSGIIADLFFEWRKLSGPEEGSVVDVHAAIAQVTDLAAGIYEFELLVVDVFTNLLDIDTVQVIVNEDTNLPPQARAGDDQISIAPGNLVILDGSASADTDGTIATFLWQQISGPAAGTVQEPDQPATAVFGLSQGIYSFELTVADNNGAIGRDTVIITVNGVPVANAGADKIIILPVNSTTLDGSASFDPEEAFPSLFFWTKISGPAAGDIEDINIQDAVADAVNLVNGTYQFELMVADIFEAVDKDTIEVRVVTPPVANAGADQIITLPASSVVLDGSGSAVTDPTATVLGFSWRQISGPGETLFGFDDAVTTATGLIRGIYSFELTVTDNNGATGKDTVVVRVNMPPIANSGQDKVVSLPANSTTLDGRNSVDRDGAIVSFLWRKISGPADGTITDGSNAVATAYNLVAGSYQFELTVRDDAGATDKDIVQVNVTMPPVANAGTDRTITLPVNSASLSGSRSTDPDGTIVKFAWTKVSGPLPGKISNATQAIATAVNLVAGVYQFRLTVTDNAGAISQDVMRVTVNSALETRLAGQRDNLRTSEQSADIAANNNEDTGYMLIYPNPTTEKLYIHSLTDCAASITDVLGRDVLELKLREGINEINIGNLPEGFYYVFAEGRPGFKVQKE